MVCVALLDVDDEIIHRVRASYDGDSAYEESTGGCMEQEFGWLEQSGISLIDYVGWQDEEDCENQRVLVSGGSLECL